MKGHTGLGLAVDQCPVDGCPAAISWQQRAVEVEGAARREAQNGLRDHVPEVEGEDELGSVAADQLCKLERLWLGLLDKVHGDPAAAGALSERLPPDLLVRVIVVGEHRVDLEALAQQRVEADAA